MKRCHSAEDLTSLDNKRRKFSLTIQPVYTLPCDVCHTEVLYYGHCIGAFVWCSVDCFEVLALRHINNIKRNSYDDNMMIFDE